MTEVISIKCSPIFGDINVWTDETIVFGISDLPKELGEVLKEFETESGQPLSSWCQSVTVTFKPKKTMLSWTPPGYFRYICTFGQDRTYKVIVGKGDDGDSEDDKKLEDQESGTFSTSYEEHVPENSCLIVYPTISPITRIESMVPEHPSTGTFSHECSFLFFNPNFEQEEDSSGDDEDVDSGCDQNCELEGSGIDSELIQKMGEAALNSVSDEQIKIEIQKLMALAMQV